MSYDHVQYIWKVVQDHIFTLEKELESYDTSNELYGRKRKKVWIFEKSTLRIGLTYAPKRAVFWLKTFFERLLENFLRAFEKQFTRKTCIFEAYLNPFLRVDFSKIQTFLRFLPYNSFDIS